MTENSVAYVVGGVAVVGALALLISLCGVVVVLPLLRRASQVDGTIRVAVIDACCLAAIIGPLSASIWNLFPDGDKTDGFIYVLAISLVTSLWWFVLAVAMSRLGNISSLHRAAYQIFVVPSAFVAPIFVLIHSIRPPTPVGDEIPQIVVCLAAYFACIPLTKWLVGQSNRGSEITAT